ncbi:hypothetical protein GCM10009788_20240 [Nocardioides humi]|uniref:Transposase DDE domain-containing protein n=1 Tax=Nocardioides humi TaxID=449461 RepID=A0ABN2AD90_9ACTN
MIHSLLAGGDCIEDVNALRAGSTGAVLGHRVAASSTVGTFLRAFGYGHARQLDAVTRRLLTRAVAAGAHHGFSDPSGSVTVDIDSTLCETYGLKKDLPQQECQVLHHRTDDRHRGQGQDRRDHR